MNKITKAERNPRNQTKTSRTFVTPDECITVNVEGNIIFEYWKDKRRNGRGNEMISNEIVIVMGKGGISRYEKLRWPMFKCLEEKKRESRVKVDGEKAGTGEKKNIETEEELLGECRLELNHHDTKKVKINFVSNRMRSIRLYKLFIV